MLYGIRRDLQASLVKAGYRVRVYIPVRRANGFLISCAGSASVRPTSTSSSAASSGKLGKALPPFEHCINQLPPHRSAVTIPNTRSSIGFRDRVRQPQHRSLLTQRSIAAWLLNSPEPHGRRAASLEVRAKEEHGDMVTSYPHSIASHQENPRGNDRGRRERGPSWRSRDRSAAPDVLRPPRSRHPAAIRAGSDVPALCVLRTPDARLGAE